MINLGPNSIVIRQRWYEVLEKKTKKFFSRIEFSLVTMRGDLTPKMYEGKGMDDEWKRIETITAQIFTTNRIGFSSAKAVLP